MNGRKDVNDSPRDRRLAAGRAWKGWVCGKCRERIPLRDVIRRLHWRGEGLSHEVSYLADYCGDQPRYETAYCGPVRLYPRKNTKKVKP